jgi:hypothetical protein
MVACANTYVIENHNAAAAAAAAAIPVRLCERWVGAGKALVAGDASHIPLLLSELPLVNWSTLRLLVGEHFVLSSACDTLVITRIA